MGNQEIKEEIQKYMEIYENENTTVQIFGMQQNYSKKEVYSNTGLPQEEKSQISKLSLHLKEL